LTENSTEKQEVNVIVGPVLIKHALLNPMANGPTRACSAYNKLCQLDAKNRWAVFGKQDLVSEGGGGFNALDHNPYSTMLPGYLSLATSYMMIEHIVPSPTKILCEPTPNETYCIYAAFGGNTPEKSEAMDEQYDYVPPVREIYAADQVFISRKRKYKKKSEDSKSVCTIEWLFDSGASIHVTPNKHLLLNSKPCRIQIRVANGRYVSASLVGDVLL
jgi:hypothetical protein